MRYRVTRSMFQVVLFFFWCTSTSWAFDLTLFHTNDVHSAYGGATSRGTPCYDALCEGGSGGTVRMLQQIQSFLRDSVKRTGGENVLFLDAGDQFQGTLFYKTHKSRIVADVVNRLGYTAIVPGNHEFDNGCSEFFAYLERLQVPVVAANLEFPDAFSIGCEPSTTSSERIRPWVVVEREGRKIGIVGLVNEDTPESSSPCAQARFLPAEPALRQAVKALQEQGVEIIIALTHLGLDADTRLGASVDGVDLIVGGHTHSYLSNKDRQAVGPYPVVVHSPSGQPVLVVTARSSGSLLGLLRVTFDDAGIPTRWTGEPLLLKDSEDPAQKTLLPPDPALMKLLSDATEPIQSLLRQPVGSVKSTGILDEANGRICRVRECLTGNAIADAMLASTSAEQTRIAFTNGGIVRASLSGGAVSRADTMSIIPFEYPLVVGTLSGQKVLDVLESGLSAYESGGGRFLQMAGIRIAFNPALPVGKRLVRAEVSVSSGNGNVWIPVDPKAEYRLVVPEYLAQGGDGFSMLSDIIWKDTGIMQEPSFAAFMSANPEFSPRIEQRILIEK